MKQLILFRHGKSNWDAEYDRDCDRPLAKRGIKAAQAMGRLLSSYTCPDCVITSSAVRAKTTIELAMQAGQWDCPIEITDQLYEANPEQVLALVHEVSNTVNTLLLVGHEPTWSELTSQLIGGGQIRFPTAAMARIDFEIETWPQVREGQGTLIWLLQPKFFTG
ncbi:MAG: histidine phosphatase family protein [Thermosynechococcaceae cyanobacterium]